MTAELRTGTLLGRYELLIQLGRGGMATVWVARERSPDGRQRLVAVKAMLPEIASRSDFRTMFLDEGQIVRSIEHQNVVRVHDVAEDHGILYMAMEWVEGDSLRAVIREAKKRRAIPPEMAVRMIADAAAGLHAAHEVRDWNGVLRGIVHCDVSPHNILIGLDGHAKLVDFGVASATAHADVESKDRIKGKFGYMSPEQADAKHLDRRSDLFSLGIVLFELTTGERLFKGSDPKETLKQVAAARIPKPTELYAKYPPKLEAVVLRALARDPAERFQTAEEFREALERYLVEERILVARASVAALLKRVLGGRLAKQRESIREALHTIDGKFTAGIIPAEILVSSRELIASSEASFTGQSLSLSSLSYSGSPSRPAPSSSDPPSGTHTHHSATTTRPQTLGGARGSRSNWLIAGISVAGLAVAVGALAWHTSSGSSAALVSQLQKESEGAVGATAASAATPNVEAKEASGVDIDSLPLDDPARQAAEAARATASGPVASARSKKDEGTVSDKRSKKDDAKVSEIANPYSKDKLANPYTEKLGADKPAADKPAAEAPPKAAEPATPKVELLPNDQRPPLNQGAAIAALGVAANQAPSCKSADGPSGSGRATVTFSPDGYVTSVSVSAPFAGTSVGNCVANHFKKAKVPPFRGSPVSLGRAFIVP